MAVINNTKSNTLLSGTSGDDTIRNGGSWDGSWHQGGSNVTIKAGKGNDLVNNDAQNAKIYLGDGNDAINNWQSNTTIDGGNGKDYIYSGGENVSINSGTGSDTIAVDGSNMTLNGGAGNDSIDLYYSYPENILIQYKLGDGNDYIEGFNETSTLSIGGGSYSTKKSGDNIIVTVGTGKISLIGAASLDKVNIKGTKATSTTKTVTDKTKSPVTVGSSVKNIDASKRTTAVKITGNALANKITGGSGKDSINGGAGNDSIYGGASNDSILGNAGNDKLYGQAGNDILKGGAGNDSLTGGKGNDSLWGGSGADVFIYSDGDGKDVIYSFGDNDMLKITGKFSATYDDSKDEIYFKVGSTANAITLKDFAAESFNINGTNYKISGSKLVKK